MNLETFLLLLGALLALPGGLFIAYLVSVPRARVASLVGGVIGDGLTALGLYYYVHASKVSIDGLSYWFGILFAAMVGVIIGALVMNFLIGVGSRNHDMTPSDV